ncbi:MAG: hypothetical protein R3A48_28865 [Polyangiales bacterium]
MDDATLLEQVRVAETRLAMLTPDSGLTDAAAALCARLVEARAREADVSLTVTLPDPWRAAIFLALGRRYGLHLHRRAGQSKQTLTVCAPRSFFSGVLWPEFEKITNLLMDRFDAITHDVVRTIAPGAEAPRRVVNNGSLGADRGDGCYAASSVAPSRTVASRAARRRST